MRKFLAAAVTSIGVLALAAGAALANDCYVAKKPVGAGAINDDGHGAFVTFAGIDFFALPASGVGLVDTPFGAALPDGARSSGPGDGCGYGVDSFETCVLGE
jgi:hypothetical protein